MSAIEDVGERLREASCVGDLDLVSKLISQGADVNSINSMNGWTALHWACKRNHITVATFLKEKGADNSIANKDGHCPAQLSSNEEIHQLFGVSPSVSVKSSKLPITPNYLANPVFPYSSDKSGGDKSDYSPPSGHAQVNNHISQHNHRSLSAELVLKARVANCEEKDFIEIDLDRHSLSYDRLVHVMCEELKVDQKMLAKVRKLPDTIIRKDKDVFRLKDFQEMEIVLTSRAMSAASRTYNLAPAKNNETILY